MEGEIGSSMVSEETLKSLGMSQEEFDQAFDIAKELFEEEDLSQRTQEEEQYLRIEAKKRLERIILGIQLPDDLPISEDLREYLVKTLPEDRLRDIRESLKPEWQTKFDEVMQTYQRD